MWIYVEVEMLCNLGGLKGIKTILFMHRHAHGLPHRKRVQWRKRLLLEESLYEVKSIYSWRWIPYLAFQCNILIHKFNNIRVDLVLQLLTR